MNKVSLFAIITAFLSVPCAHAADGTINFTGNITETACSVNISTQSVDLGTVSASALNGLGTTAAPTRFTISLITCPAAVSTAKVRFDGTTATGNSSILKLNVGETATNVGVAIYEDDSYTLIPVGSLSAAKTLVSTGANDLTYIAKYMATGTPVSAGTANATATFTITYS